MWEQTYVEDLETGDIKYSNEVVSVQSLLIESNVTLLDQPMEHTGIQTLRHRSHGPVDLHCYCFCCSFVVVGIVYLFHVLALVHPLGSDLHTRLQERLNFEILDFRK